MKDHVKELRYVEVDGPVAEVIAGLEAASVDLVDAVVGLLGRRYVVTGWRPMNEKELEKAKKQRKQAREAKRRQKEAAEATERAELQRLAEKHGVSLFKHVEEGKKV